jgi:cytosine deaminase
MSQHFDILVKQARLRYQPYLVDIGIENGQIIALETHLEGEPDLTMDAQGNLVTESFVNPHLHLCKVYTRQMMDDEALTGYHAEGMGKAMTTIELAARVKRNMLREWIIKNVTTRASAGSLVWQYPHTRLRMWIAKPGLRP